MTRKCRLLLLTGVGVVLLLGAASVCAWWFWPDAFKPDVYDSISRTCTYCGMVQTQRYKNSFDNPLEKTHSKPDERFAVPAGEHEHNFTNVHGACFDLTWSGWDEAWFAFTEIWSIKDARLQDELIKEFVKLDHENQAAVLTFRIERIPAEHRQFPIEKR